MKGWNGMKQFLFVFLILGWAVTANASEPINVLVYDMKVSNAGFGYVADTNTWTQIKDANAAFLIIEIVDDHTANVRAVYTWKGKDKQKYAMDVNMGQAQMGSATTGSKETGFFVDANTHSGTRIQLSGANKLVTIGKKTNKSCLYCHDAADMDGLGDLQIEGCPPSLTGYEIKNIIQSSGNKKLCTSTVSLKLDIPKTLATHDNVDNAEDEANTLLSDLYDAGYIIVEP
jgi:hypothetical protein